MPTEQELYSRFTFEKSGLPDHPVIRTAYDLMLKCEIGDSLIHYKDMCIQRDIKRAAYVANGWSSDPDVIAAALLRGAYANAETQRGTFPTFVGDRVAGLVRETEKFEAGEDDPKRHSWSDDAKTIIYADCVQSLASWNASLSTSFAEIAQRNEGQIVDPQYLGPYDNLVKAAAFIQKDLNPTAGSPVAKAISDALAGSAPVVQSIQTQSKALAARVAV